MKNNIKQMKHRVFNSFELRQTYVKINGAEIPAGRAIFDKDTGMVVNTVSDNYYFLSVKDIYKNITKDGAEANHIKEIAESKDKKTVYVRGTFSNISFKDDSYLFLAGFTIGNSFNGRFMPFANFNLFDPVEKIWVETSIPILTVSRAKGMELSLQSMGLLEDYLGLYKNIAINYPFDVLPKKLQGEGIELAVEGDKLLESNNKIEVLKWAGRVAKKWKATSFELARNFQLKVWSL